MSISKSDVQGDQVRLGPEFQRILVPTDFSEGAKVALEYVRVIARKFQSKIFLLHVIPSDAFEFASREISNEALARAREYAKQQLQVLMNDDRWDGIIHESIVAEGSVWPTVSETVKSKHIDLIAIGTHGKTNSKTLVLGPVAEKIYRMADCPILTVPPRSELSETPEIELKNILFAANFKPHNERAAAVAHVFECRQQMKLTVVHVIENSGESSLAGQTLVKEFILNRMQKVLPEGCVAECHPEFDVRFGEPVDEILASAKERHADLILLGLRATQRTAGHLPSAIAYGIVCRSTCPVLTLHQ